MPQKTATPSIPIQMIHRRGEAKPSFHAANPTSADPQPLAHREIQAGSAAMADGMPMKGSPSQPKAPAIDTSPYNAQPRGAIHSRPMPY